MSVGEWKESCVKLVHTANFFIHVSGSSHDEGSWLLEKGSREGRTREIKKKGGSVVLFLFTRAPPFPIHPSLLFFSCSLTSTLLFLLFLHSASHSTVHFHTFHSPPAKSNDSRVPSLGECHTPGTHTRRFDQPTLLTLNKANTEGIRERPS